MTVFGLSLCWFIIIATGLNLINRREWWFRIFDFPRAQLAGLGLLGVVCLLYSAWASGDFQAVLSGYVGLILGLSLLATVFHARLVLPYTPLWHRTVSRAKLRAPERQIRILLSNVLQTNTQFDRLITLINHHQPDVIITMETDVNWEQALAPIEADYSQHIKCAQSNFYGMHLFSKLPLNNAKECTMIHESIPSIHTDIQLPNQQRIRLHCIHPRPPSPTEAPTSKQRDNEMRALAERIDHTTPSIAAGDFNDVPWSKSMHRFLSQTQLKDPRKGRVMVNTFHAGYPLVRWPLDHVFHTEHFELVHYKRLPSIQSDHFPLLVTLQLKADD